MKEKLHLQSFIQYPQTKYINFMMQMVERVIVIVEELYNNSVIVENQNFYEDY